MRHSMLSNKCNILLIVNSGLVYRYSNFVRHFPPRKQSSLSMRSFLPSFLYTHFFAFCIALSSSASVWGFDSVHDSDNYLMQREAILSLVLPWCSETDIGIPSEWFTLCHATCLSVSCQNPSLCHSLSIWSISRHLIGSANRRDKGQAHDMRISSRIISF
jgi:hypothetical protein